MRTHNGYKTQEDLGAKCTKCEDWIPVGEEAVLMESTTIDERGSARTNSKAFHGVLCMDCYEGI